MGVLSQSLANALTVILCLVITMEGKKKNPKKNGEEKAKSGLGVIVEIRGCLLLGVS